MSTMNKNTVVEMRHLLWSLVPTIIVMIFAAGGLNYTIQATSSRIREDEVRYDQQNKDISLAIQKQSTDIGDIKVSIAKLETNMASVLQIMRDKP